MKKIIKVSYLALMLTALVMFGMGCPMKPAKPLPKYKVLLIKHLSAMKKIKTAVFNEIKQDSECNDLTKIIDSINKRNNDKSGLLSNKIEGGQYLINKDIKIWKDFILKNKGEEIIVIYCKTYLYPKATGNKYFAGTLETMYYPRKDKPVFKYALSSESIKAKK